MNVDLKLKHDSFRCHTELSISKIKNVVSERGDPSYASYMLR